VEPDGARIFRRQPQTRADWRRNTRAKNDPFANELYFREEDFVIADRATEVAKERGVTASQVALAWVLSKPISPHPLSGPARSSIWIKPSPRWRSNSQTMKSNDWKKPISRIQCWDIRKCISKSYISVLKSTSFFGLVIPMAGWGTRMRPHTLSKPKPLVSVAGKTALEHLMDMFKTMPNPENLEYVFIVGPFLGELQLPAFIKEKYPRSRRISSCNTR
jgi:hypothetical protein